MRPIVLAARLACIDDIPFDCKVNHPTLGKMSGRVVGRRLDGPFVMTEQLPPFGISWRLAAQLKLGEVEAINYI